MTTDEQLAVIRRTLIEMAAAIVATRRAVNIVANQPTLLLNQTDRQSTYNELKEGIERMDKALDLLQQLTEPSNE